MKASDATSTRVRSTRRTRPSRVSTSRPLRVSFRGRLRNFPTASSEPVVVNAMSAESARRRVTDLSSHNPINVDSYKADIKNCRRELRKLIDSVNCHPILLRLAWHDAGTYDDSVAQWPDCGGANGSIRFDTEMSHGANAGLRKALTYLAPMKERFPNLSWADIIQLGGATAIEVAGGAVIPMKYGRVDVLTQTQCPKEGNLPDAEPPFAGDETIDASEHLRRVFYRMGFGDEEIVALSGAHTIGRAFAERSGTTAFGIGTKKATRYTGGCPVIGNTSNASSQSGGCPFAPPRKDGTESFGMPGGQSWTKKWLTFDNSYFKREYVDEPKELLWLSTDKALHVDVGFAPWFKLFGDDQTAFFDSFAKAFAKLSERGARFLPAGGIEA